MLFAHGSERGKAALEIVGWAAATSLVLVVAGYIVIAKPGQAKTPRLTAEQQAYVQAVATQQALSYISAIATQQADSAAARPSAPEPVIARAPVAPALSAPQAPPPPPAAQQAPPIVQPTNAPKPAPAVPQPTATADNSAALATCKSKVQQESAVLNDLASQYRQGSGTALSDFNKRLREVTSGVINECALVMQAGG